LKKNKNKLKQLAERLLEKEVIFKDDLFNILGERPFDVKPDKKQDGKDGVKVAVN
jgi:cell division protease FtsH